ncbi:toprim domain-containing protein [Kribbella solani]|uniref:toprim domain-containing protein n=1 Tax=Kribbella solani TaxID=236067 RepID=UPI0029BF4FEF|nr:toprim domain-containing protein [Kribbella solani]MDX3002031.1 toprim domain-containing protein [Kribbella solani]
MNTRLYEAHTAAASFYRRQLVENRDGWAAAHLRNRGLGALLACDSRWCVGYAPEGWSRLVGHLRRAGFDDQAIVRAGLASVTRNGYLVDRFRDRVVFVAHDRELRPVGFVSRARGTRLRYLNTARTEIFVKGQTLVGLDAQLDRLRSGAIPVLVEGAMDAPAVGLAGDDWVGVACCGTAITPEQARIVRAHSWTDAVIVALDGDVGGRAGAVRSLPILRDVFDDVLFARLPDKADPASLHAANPRLLRDVLTTARPLVEFAIEIELAKWSRVLDHVSGQVNAVRAVAPLIASLPAERVAKAVARLAGAVQLDEQIVSNEIVAAAGRCSRGRSRGRRRPSRPGGEVGNPLLVPSHSWIDGVSAAHIRSRSPETDAGHAFDADDVEGDSRDIARSP